MKEVCEEESITVEEVISFVVLFYRVERCIFTATILETLGDWWPHFKTNEDLFLNGKCSKSASVCFFNQNGKQFKIDTFQNIECSWFNAITSVNKKLDFSLISYNKNGIYFVFNVKRFLINLVFVYIFETAQTKM